MRVPWTARRSSQSILREISLEYSLEGPVLMLKLQNFGHLMRTADSLEKTLMLGKIESRRRRGCHRMRWLHSITETMDMNLENSGRCKGQGGLACCSPCDRKELDMTWQLNNNNIYINTHTHTYICMLSAAYLVAQMVKNLPAMQEIWVQSLGREDSLKKVMATHSSILVI